MAKVKTTQTWLAKCPHGTPVAAGHFDDPKRAATVVADWIRRGFTPERATDESVRACGLRQCWDCQPKASMVAGAD